jgi:hypothetical protein
MKSIFFNLLVVLILLSVFPGQSYQDQYELLKKANVSTFCSKIDQSSYNMFKKLLVRIM